MLAQFKFPSPFSRAYLGSPQLLQDALARIHIGPFQTDGELLCLMFLTPVQDEPDETGVTLRPWTTFSRVLDDLYDHPDQFRSVTPSDRWLEWLQELDEQAPFTPSDKLDLMRGLWKLMEKATDGKPSHTFTMQECVWELCDRKSWTDRYRPPPITQLQVLKWRHWRPAQLRDLEPTTQRALEEKLRTHWANRLISHLIPSWAMGMTTKSFCTSWEMPGLVPLDSAVCSLRSSRSRISCQCLGLNQQSARCCPNSKLRNVLQTTFNRHGIR